jgi:hypothetical protein
MWAERYSDRRLEQDERDANDHGPARSPSEQRERQEHQEGHGVHVRVVTDGQ